LLQVKISDNIGEKWKAERFIHDAARLRTSQIAFIYKTHEWHLQCNVNIG